MRVIIQRSGPSQVSIDGDIVGKIDKGYVLLVGVGADDTQDDADYLARKISHMRLFEDSDGKTNLSLEQIGGDILSISQFTLYASTKKGNRPSFTRAGKPELAEELYLYLNDQLRQNGFKVEEGKFGANMQVTITNDGPVTILLDSKNKE